MTHLITHNGSNKRKQMVGKPYEYRWKPDR